MNARALAALGLTHTVAFAACGGDDAARDAADAAATEVADSSGDDGHDAAPDATAACLDFDPAMSPFFGDLHVHTRLSLDANLQGTRLGPADAYRFARGEEVGIQPYTSGGAPLRTLRLERPLDFAAVTDHAEFLGLVHTCQTPGAPGYDHDECQRYRDDPDGAFVRLNAYVAAAQGGTAWPAACGDGGADCLGGEASAWDEIREAAAAAHDATPACTFTTFVGYEWSGAPGTQNLHRNVIFESDKVPARPVSYFDESWPDGLWTRLDTECGAIPGCRVLVIPHNSNLSSGLMFEAKKRDGSPIDRAYAERQAAMEPLVEIMQHKGDSECLPGTPIADERCGFEKVPYNNLGSANLGIETPPVPSDFVRAALGQGLALQVALGVNPFQMGIIASTDTHLGTPGAVSERTYPGHGGAGAAARDELPPGLVDQVAFNPGGLVGVWAEENSRRAIFAALARKEVWGTSGPRIVVRFFGGHDLPDGLCEDAALATVARARGVPMGGVLPHGPEGAPRFVVAAQRDPGTEAEPSAPLATIQIVKGWLEGGVFKTTTIDVAGGDDGQPGPDTTTCAPPTGGHDRLCASFVDPDFDPAEPAFWYVRVLERPTCRWSTIQCNAAGVDCGEPETIGPGFGGCCDPDVERTIRERAWSSPIWWTP
ncbi:MAG: DUF3604 domain-containing protein [Deltaproteobacteria bacterium]|nr:DUF3604 domain-containing protein [Deltaproteobacteria bacterium]